MPDFNQIVLTEDETFFLDELYRSNTWLNESRVPNSVDPYRLEDLGLIESMEFSGYFFYLISDLGERYLLFLWRNDRRHFWSEFRAWFAIAISVVALVVSIVALVS